MPPEPKGTEFSATDKSKLLSLLTVGFLAFGLTLLSQEVQHDVSVINIEVPVRVFMGDVFVDSLSIDDFEVYEDGMLQKIEAVYLIKKTNIEKKEDIKKIFAPEVSRHFVLTFELHEYLPKIGDALDYFFDNVLVPGDTLNVVTPVKTYNFKSEAFTRLSKQKMANQLKGKLKKDITQGNSEYRSLMKHLEEIIVFEVEPDIKQSMYLDAARKLKDLKYLDQKKLISFADFLKNMKGQKYVFMFYQKELVPVLPGIDEFSLQELKKDISFDVEKIKQAFSDSSISVHFLFVTNKPGMHDDLNVGRMQQLRVELLDQSDSIFNAFKVVSNATGGIVDSSANAAASFQKAVDAAENYYLIYYPPKDYKADGKFKEIKVKVKDKKYRITHRAGYFAN